MKIQTSDIFEVASSPDNVVCPPTQVFKNKNFVFLLVIGGHMVEDNSEYQRLMTLLKEIGESEFTIIENLGATKADRTKPFIATIPINTSLDYFNKKIYDFDELFGLLIWHWFVHGQKNTWGIYISEYPTINIIGCTPELVDKFRDVFKIEGTGYEQVESFLDKEFSGIRGAEMKYQFLENYKIKTTPHNKA